MKNIFKNVARAMALAGTDVYCADIYTAKDAERYYN